MDFANRSTMRMTDGGNGCAPLCAFLLVLGCLALAQPCLAGGPIDDDPGQDIIEKSEALRPGQYTWAGEGEEYVQDGPVLVVVFLGSQRARIYRGGFLIGITTISSGKRGHRTPTGMFSILQKKRFHRSNLYDDAPMPFMLRLTWDGLAIHGGVLPGYPASHGCIRIPTAFARKLFGIVTFDASVVVTEQ